jgi:hypothetical protein
MSLETTPDLTDNELLFRIEHHLFKEMVSNITIGFADNDQKPLSLEEQKSFFERQDIRESMRNIILEIFEVTREEGNTYHDDFYRQLIYDESDIGIIYTQIGDSRMGEEEEYANFQGFEELQYDDYIPQFPRN